MMRGIVGDNDILDRCTRTYNHLCALSFPAKMALIQMQVYSVGLALWGNYLLGYVRAKDCYVRTFEPASQQTRQ